MSVSYNVEVYNNPFVKAIDTPAVADTIVLRDGGGGITANGVFATLLQSLVLQLAVHASVTTSLTLDNTAFFWPCNANGGALTETLPPAASCAGQLYAIRKTDSSSNHVTIAGNSAELINEANTYVLTAQDNSAILVCDGAAWHVLAKF